MRDGFFRVIRLHENFRLDESICFEFTYHSSHCHVNTSRRFIRRYETSCYNFTRVVRRNNANLMTSESTLAEIEFNLIECSLAGGLVVDGLIQESNGD